MESTWGWEIYHRGLELQRKGGGEDIEYRKVNSIEIALEERK